MLGTVSGLANGPYPRGRGESRLRSTSSSVRICGCFPDELPGLPPHRDVDFGIELHPGTLPISMTPHRMAPVECRNLEFSYRSYWTRGSLDRALHHGVLRFCLQKRKTIPFDCVLTTDS